MTRTELLEIAKPILFNTEMVRAILDGRKTVTRRVIKPQPPKDADLEFKNGMEVAIDNLSTLWNDRQFNYKPPFLPYRILTGRADYLYVRETFSVDERLPYDNYFYRADDEIPEGWHLTSWKPSIHMPKEAARIFLKVTGVRCEKLQDITGDDCLREGIANDVCSYNGHGYYCNCIDKFSSLWNSTIKKKDFQKYKRQANPWVWVIEFERIDVE